MTRSVYYRIQPDPIKARIDEIAWFLSEKRRIVQETLDIKLAGCQDDDWYRAENLYQEFRHEASPPVYQPQIETACELFKQMFVNGKRNHQLSSPFQNGKTGAGLCLTEIYLQWARLNKKHAQVLHIPLNGQREIEQQLRHRVEQYCYTSSVDCFHLNVKAKRCNGTRDDIEELSRLVESATTRDGVLILPDESQWGTATGSLFDKMVLSKLRSNAGAAVLLVSATPYEQFYSEAAAELFGNTMMKLCKGYVGPRKMNGMEFPYLPGYTEEDVLVVEGLPPDLQYYSAGGLDYKKIEALCDFIHQTYGFRLAAVRWNSIAAAEYASDYVEKNYNKVVRHYSAKHLKDRLRRKWNKEDEAALFIVDTMKCSQTLPMEITSFIDTTTFNHFKQKSTVTAVGQAGYGRMCGHGRHGARFITAPGVKQYIERYKEEAVKNFKAPVHTRVARKEEGAVKGKKGLTFEMMLLETNERDIKPKLHSNTVRAWEDSGAALVSVEDSVRLAQLMMQYIRPVKITQGERAGQSSYRRDKLGDQETLLLVQKYFPNATGIEYWSPTATQADPDGHGYENINRHRDPNKVTLLHSKGVIWGISYSEHYERDAVEGVESHVTKPNSVYAPGNVEQRFAS